ncbi:MAG: hypothetical protein VKL39_11545 [Leptolyngbyaceae bacterium]|nr:hypothetical protein [Leptolyngbyaceae bacterium]
MLKKIAIFGIVFAALGIALPANAELAETYSPDEETIVGGREVSLPSVPVTPWRYALPMEISIIQDSSITTDTPITDAMSDDVSAWGEAVAGCLTLSPEMVRETVAGNQPFIVSDAARTIHLNANSSPVCPL